MNAFISPIKMFIKLHENKLMKNSFLRPAITQTTTIVDKDSGEILEQDMKTVKYLANNREEFYFMYASLLGIMERMSGPQIKVYSYILRNYIVNSEIGLPKALKKNIGDYLGLTLGTINNTLSELVEKKLLYTTQRSIYKINPRYAFKGSTKDRNALLKVVLELECPDC